jgi:opacity protein-like surface antigen
VKDQVERSRVAHAHASLVTVLLVGLLFFLPFDALADGWISGFAGRAYGGVTDLEFSEAIKNRETWTYGFNAGTMGGGVFGAEFDFGYTPKFFGSGAAVDKSGVMTIMASLIAGIPVGGQYGAGIRPYGFFGLGLIRRNLEFVDILDNITTNDFGYNLGGGIMGFFNRTVGIRGEYRYFRNFKKDDIGSGLAERSPFDFSRASLGIVLRF